MSDDADADALRFLKSPQCHGVAKGEVRWIETHMSWVFIVRDEVLKLKKPLRSRYLDHSTKALREFDCREEVRLNARLAPGVYLGLAALQQTPSGYRLLREEALPAPGETVDWLVRMRRLPEDDRLDCCIAQRRIDAPRIEALAAVLGRFYRAAPPLPVPPAEHLGLFRREQEINREVLLDPHWQLAGAAPALDGFDVLLAQQASALAARAAEGALREGHGDLRPEHVFLLDPPVVIDCLEFSARLRCVDPFDEIAFLGLECEVAGAAWIGPALVAGLVAAGCRPPAPALMQLYRAARSLLRARLAIAHLLDPLPRQPERWPALAERYLACCLRCCLEAMRASKPPTR